MNLLHSQSVAPRGADRMAAGPPRDPGASPGIGAAGRRVVRLAVAAVVLVAGAAAAQRWIVTTKGFVVRRVTIEGAAHADVASLILATAAIGVNTFQVDLDAVRDRLRDDPWIADARVRRVLPHQLRVVVEERVPVGMREARGSCALVDGTGRILGTEPAPGRLPLPSILGLEGPDGPDSEGRLARAAASLAAIRMASPGVFRRLRAIDASVGDRFTLVSDSLPPIWIDGPESANEVAAYGSRIETIRRTFGDIAYVDARWRNRLFIMESDRGDRKLARDSGDGAG